MKIGLIGDYIKDYYIYGKYTKISQESPIPVFLEDNFEFRFGGSGNVEANLIALGAEVEHHHCNEEYMSEKVRYVVDNHIVFRADNETYVRNDKSDFKFSDDIKYVILSDYNKGFIHDPRSVIRNLKKAGKFVIVDPKKPLDAYTGSDILKLNQDELMKYGFGEDAQEIRKRLGCKALIITRGREGVVVYDDIGDYYINTANHQVSDVTGAGDVFIASFTFYLAKGESIKDAAIKATKLASLSVTKFGTYTLTDQDIRTVTPKIVFTNGCFDILHKGHIDYLQKSKALGDKLIVGLNSDRSIRKLKGLCRPINNQDDRKTVLESLDCVDEVIIFDDETPYNLIKKIKPSLITKGGDYTVDTVVGNDLAEVVIVPLVEGYSTTKILEKAS